jgi:hypothetical protein
LTDTRLTAVVQRTLHQGEPVAKIGRLSALTANSGLLALWLRRNRVIYYVLLDNYVITHEMMIHGGQGRRAGWRDDSHHDGHIERHTDWHGELHGRLSERLARSVAHRLAQ